jgi:nitrate/nitrite transporter NarK
MQKHSLIAVCAAGFAFSANYTNHAPMVSTLQGEFGFDRTSAGLLTTGIFLTHALMQVPGGRLADRFGSARMMGLALAWVAFGNFAIATSGAYWQLLAWKIFVGFGTALTFTAGARYVVQSFTGKAVHLAQGMFGGSIVLGSGFVIFAVPQMLGAFGWRGAFVGSAMVVVAALVYWMAAAPKPEQKPALKHAGSLAEMATHGDLWLLGIMQMASFGLVIVAGSWIATLLKNGYKMPLGKAGMLGSLVLLLGIVTRPLGGWLLHRLNLRTIVPAALLLNAAACAMLAWGQSIELTVAAVVALGFGCGVPYAAIFTMAARLYPGRAATAMGFVNMVGIAMILVGAPAVGWLADWSGNFRTGFFALGAFSFVAAGAAFLLQDAAP